MASEADMNSGPKTVRILMVDDHAIVREALRLLLEEDLEMEIVGEAGDGRTALNLAEQLQPDIVLMDIGLPDGDGMFYVRQLLSRSPAVRVIILSGILDRQHLEDAIQAGVWGYVLKTNSATDLIKTIRSAMRSETYIPSEVSSMLLGNYKELLGKSGKSGSPPISTRETEVLKLIAKGRNTKEIADELSLSVKTVESHRVRVMSKLSLHNVAELTRYAISEGLVPL